MKKQLVKLNRSLYWIFKGRDDLKCTIKEKKGGGEKLDSP